MGRARATPRRRVSGGGVHLLGPGRAPQADRGKNPIDPRLVRAQIGGCSALPFQLRTARRTETRHRCRRTLRRQPRVRAPVPARWESRVMDSSSLTRPARVGALALLVVAFGCSSDKSTPRARSRTNASTTTVAAGKPVQMDISFDAPTLLAPACGPSGACVYPLSRTTTRVTGSFTGGTVSAGAGTPK